ncbi:flavodoxin [Mycolicibacterium canariasense]|uniref:Flavodoxin n=1 Tax=Mycolicibacterium canariasense TaxID=228230 RepID=A0A100W7I9_MYCCR|nr:hypothetical protein AWB94_25985 [Mycolicibacterium canariasense]GAS93134.1 flavodoxin [Mycolicibacterium canariasense]
MLKSVDKGTGGSGAHRRWRHINRAWVTEFVAPVPAIFVSEPRARTEPSTLTTESVIKKFRAQNHKFGWAALRCE